MDALNKNVDVTGMWFDFDEVIRDKFKAVVVYEDKEHTIYGMCQLSENAVKFFDPIREIIGIKTASDFTDYLDKGKTFRSWIEGLIQEGKYGKSLNNDVKSFYESLGEINATHEVY